MSLVHIHCAGLHVMGKVCGFHLRDHRALGKNLAGGDPAGGDIGARLPPDAATDKQRLAWKLPRLFTRNQTGRFFSQ